MNDSLTEFNMPHLVDVAWCPGCGSRMLQKAVTLALHELMIEPENFAMVSGIGQAIKLSNRKVVVIAESGNDDMLGEGSDHFLHAIRRNTDISVIVHNSMACGLTKTPAPSPSPNGVKRVLKTNGVKHENLNPLGVAMTMNAPFIARACAGNIEHTKLMIMAAIGFRGVSVIDVLQPCAVFNKLSTYQWFKNNIHHLPNDHDTTDRNAAFRLATGSDKLPLGIFFRNETDELCEDLMGIDTAPLFQPQQSNEKTFQNIIDACR
jgi:2-oxoglutarate ferredoxin oxidoreductase subunit beta